MANNDIKEISWLEFRESGLLLIVNQFLHIFGLAIVMDMDDKTTKVFRVYPARVKFRGFTEKSIDSSYLKVSEYMNKNSKKLLKENRNNG